MDLGALWNGVTNGLNWIFSLVVLILVWILGRFGAVASRRAEAALDRLWARALTRRRSRRSARELGKKEHAESERIARIERERVGSRFIYRASPEDQGMVGEVLRLDQRDPKRRVIIAWSSPPARTPQEDDYAEGLPYSIEWKHLVMPPKLQVHRTARVVAKSNSDADGWVEFESL